MSNIEDALKGRIDTRTHKVVFAFFLVLVLILVSLRLWSDSRFRAVPYPNQVAVSADGVAIVSGPIVYHYSTDGVEIGSYALSDRVQTTQLFWDKGSLYLADMADKNVLVLNAGEAARNFNGQRINAQFKVVREPATGNLFVSDGANHRILVFDPSYRFLRSFGHEGNSRGEFRFPNNMFFEESGRLLIANTKRSTIDLYSPEGKFLSTLVNSAGNGVYRYPTDFIVTPDRLLVLENDGYLNRGRVRVYDRTGVKIGELDLGESRIIGTLTAYGDTIYLTDSENREIKTYSLTDLQPLGPFSLSFEVKCMAWTREAGFYGALSLMSLLALVVFIAPVIFFYVKIKNEENKEIARTDLSSLMATAEGNNASPADLILGTPVNQKKKAMAIILLVAGAVCMPLMIVAGKRIPPPVSITVIFFCLIAFVSAIRLFSTSGALSSRLQKQTELIVKKLVSEGKLVLQPGEQAERIAHTQGQKSALETVLLVFTTKRLLYISLSWGKVVRMEQFPFESIRTVDMPKKDFFTSKPVMQVTLSAGSEKRNVKLYHFTMDYLRLLGEEFSRRVGKSSGVPHAVLCMSCLQPMQGDNCLHCANKLTPDWTPVLLSILFPGLGQLRNGEMKKGLVYVIAATVILLVGYLSIKAWFFEGADITMKQKTNIISLIIAAPVLYISNIVDAYRSGIRSRKRQRS
jgi:hypothetical protein